MVLSAALGLIFAAGALGGAGYSQAASATQVGESASPAQPESELESLRRRTEEAEERRKERELAVEQAPGKLAALRLETPGSVPEPDRKATPAPTIGELKGQVDLAQGLLGAARDTATALEAKAKARSERLLEIPGEIVALRGTFEAAKVELDSLSQSTDSAERSAVLEATMALDGAQIQALEARRSQINAEAEWIQLQRDRAQARASAAARAAERWSSWLNERRLALGDDAAVQAEKRLDELVMRFPVLKEATLPEREHLAMLVGDEGLVSQIAAAEREIDRLKLQDREIERRMESASERLDLGGLTEGMGATLQRDFVWLPMPRALRAEASARNARLSEAELRKLDVEDLRDGLTDLGAAADELIAGLDLKEPIPVGLRDEAVGLLRDRRSAFEAVLTERVKLVGHYVTQRALAGGLSASAAQYREIIEEHILWVRGTEPFSFSKAAEIPRDVVRFAADHSVSTALRRGSEALRHSPFRAALIGVLLIGLLFMRRRIKARREEIGRQVRSYRTDRFWLTGQALVQTALLSAPWPLLLAGIAWLLSIQEPADASPLDPALGALSGALIEVASIWFALRFMRGIASEKGVGTQHFRWPSVAMAAVRREIRWYLPFVVVFGFLALYLDRLREPGWTNSVGRVSFVIWMVGLSTFLRRLLGVGSDLWSSASAEEGGLLWRTRRVWTLVFAAMPLALLVLSLAGFDYTALRFENRLRLSLAVALALVFIHALLLRWLLITRRRLAVSQALDAKARREQNQEKEEEVSESGVPTVDVDKVDIPAVDAQTRQLFKSALTLASFAAFYVIWSSTLPALRGFDRVQLYPRFAMLEADSQRAGPLDFGAPAVTGSPEPDEAEPAGAGATVPIPGMIPSAGQGDSARDGSAAPSGAIPASLTLGDLLMALIFGVLTAVAARNLPALLELAILQRLPMDGGARYAVSTITRYVILVIGVSAVSGALGVGWQHIQWLAAALTFGLAFGLQEIFANFVSGLIILVERPIRVGDIVTVAGTEGRVTQLRMRATTILDWDRKESLIPNKEFITGSIVNWTLSDPVTRVVIPVGIAYGSDTELARRLLLEVAHANELVMVEPKPVAIFKSFGDSTLDFQLRVFIESRDVWPEMVDRLHSEIDAAFRKAKVEIAFPQRDIHIRSTVERDTVERDPK